MACDAASRSASDRLGSTSADTSTTATGESGGASSETGTDPRCHTRPISPDLDRIPRRRGDSLARGAGDCSAEEGTVMRRYGRHARTIGVAVAVAALAMVVVPSAGAQKVLNPGVFT